MRRPVIIAILVVLGIAVAGTAGWVFFGRDWMQAREEARVIETLRSDPRTVRTAASIKEWTAGVAAHPDDLDLLLSLANAWKEAADLSGDATHYRRAEALYERGIEKSEGKNTVFMQNLAVALRLDKRPEEAERILRRALEVRPDDPALYVALVEVMRFDLHRDHAEIIDVYQSGLDQLIDNAPLVQSLARYLEDVGRLEEALTYYELLAVKYPGFDEKIASLKRTIASQP